MDQFTIVIVFCNTDRATSFNPSHLMSPIFRLSFRNPNIIPQVWWQVGSHLYNNRMSILSWFQFTIPNDFFFDLVIFSVCLPFWKQFLHFLFRLSLSSCIFYPFFCSWLGSPLSLTSLSLSLLNSCSLCLSLSLLLSFLSCSLCYLALFALLLFSLSCSYWHQVDQECPERERTTCNLLDLWPRSNNPLLWRLQKPWASSGYSSLPLSLSRTLCPSILFLVITIKWIACFHYTSGKWTKYLV